MLHQAKEYAEAFGLKFSYTTNGAEIIEVDDTTGIKLPVSTLCSLQEVWQHQRTVDVLTNDNVVKKLPTPTYPDKSKPLCYDQAVTVNRTVRSAVFGRECILLSRCIGPCKTIPLQMTVVTDVVATIQAEAE